MRRFLSQPGQANLLLFSSVFWPPLKPPGGHGYTDLVASCCSEEEPLKEEPLKGEPAWGLDPRSLKCVGIFFPKPMSPPQALWV